MLKTSFYGNPYIGMFVRANDNYALIPEDSSQKFENSICEHLKVEIIRTNICDSALLGLYTIMNSNGIIVPEFVYEKELKEIKQTGLNIYVMRSRFTAIGNLVCCNDNGAMVSEYIDAKTRKEIGDTLGVETITGRIAGYKTCGSACVCTNKGFVVHNDISESEMKKLEKVLGVEGINGTVNFGFEFPMYGIIANSKGYIVGERTTGIELMRIDQGLGFSKKVI